MTSEAQSRPGLLALQAEMDRQHADALASFEAARHRAEVIADSVRRTGRLVLLGMGGSHWANRTAAVTYRRAGIDVTSEVLSELLVTPLTRESRTALITSQSGDSGEVVRYLETAPDAEERFGLTLNADSALGRGVPSLLGVGGPEKAFAATRSLIITHALHLAVQAALGISPAAALAALRKPDDADPSSALQALDACTSFLLSGRETLQGVAESGALCLMELRRLPALGLDGGQLRHGPIEVLSPTTGVILLRGPGPAAALTGSLAEECRSAGAPVVVIDCSGEPPTADTVTIALPSRDGMAAVFGALPPLQRILVGIAARHIPDVGQPLRSSKVTTTL